MATGEPDDIDALLAQVDASLNPGRAAPPAKAVSKKQRADAQKADGDGGGIGERLGKAALSGAVAGVVVGLLFMLVSILPLIGLNPFVGGLGAFVGGFLVDLARGR